MRGDRGLPGAQRARRRPVDVGLKLGCGARAMVSGRHRSSTAVVRAENTAGCLPPACGSRTSSASAVGGGGANPRPASNCSASQRTCSDGSGSCAAAPWSASHPDRRAAEARVWVRTAADGRSSSTDARCQRVAVSTRVEARTSRSVRRVDVWSASSMPLWRSQASAAAHAGMLGGAFTPRLMTSIPGRRARRRAAVIGDRQMLAEQTTRMRAVTSPPLVRIGTLGSSSASPATHIQLPCMTTRATSRSHPTFG